MVTEGRVPHPRLAERAGELEDAMRQAVAGLRAKGYSWAACGEVSSRADVHNAVICIWASAVPRPEVRLG